jgi:SAM-dependent methyltransferase
MSFFYRLLYGVGITPWEEMHQHVAGEQVAALLEEEESGREPPYGQALDVGCGSGIWSVKLAQRGWTVTGVVFIPHAICWARQRAQVAGANAQFIEGDAAALQASGIGSGYRLVMDFGCFHGLSDGQRAGEGRDVSAVAAPDASILILSFQPGRRGPLPRGASRDDILAAFPGWAVAHEEKMDTTGAPKRVQQAEPRFYRLRRQAVGQPAP